MNEQRHYRGGFVWPIILIGAGVVFLLNNLGIVGWSIWETLLRLWPILLIAAGLDLLVGRRFPLGSVLLALLLIVVLVLAVQGTLKLPAVSANAGVDHTETISQDLGSEERASIDIQFGTGNLNVTALGEGSRQLVQGTLDLSRNERLTDDFRVSNGVGYYTLKSEGSWSWGAEVFTDEGKNWDLGLNRDIQLDLEVDAGAGKSMLDLAALNLRRFKLDGGVGQVTVKLPVRGRYDMTIDGGIGQVILMVPQGLGARVRVDGGLGGVDVQGDFRQQGDEYTTSNYNTAENRATLEVKGGIGQIIIKMLSE